MEVEMDTLVHTHLLLGRGQKKQLRTLGAARQASMAALVRDAIDHYLRVVAGPSPVMVRCAARATVGVLPPEPHSDDQMPPDGSRPSYGDRAE
jgi:hypothetical protein